MQVIPCDDYSNVDLGIAVEPVKFNLKLNHRKTLITQDWWCGDTYQSTTYVFLSVGFDSTYYKYVQWKK